jgi:hypothetical protein
MCLLFVWFVLFGGRGGWEREREREREKRWTRNEDFGVSVTDGLTVVYTGNA